MPNYVWKKGKAVKIENKEGVDKSQKNKSQKNKSQKENKEPQKTENPLEKLSIEELIKIAKENNIQISENVSKEDLIELITKNG